jgi:hypothetical protein
MASDRDAIKRLTLVLSFLNTPPTVAPLRFELIEFVFQLSHPIFGCTISRDKGDRLTISF